jgi:hypothetical protein
LERNLLQSNLLENNLFNGRGAFHAAVKTHRKGGLALVKGAGAERLERVEKTLSA